MNAPKLQRLKMEWLAAKEAGDSQAQNRLLREYPAEQDELISFIAAYHATGSSTNIDQDAPLLPVTQKALQNALERVFEPQLVFASLGELRKSRSMSKAETARGLRLSLDVWNKFETGAIELVSLSQHQLERLARFFQVSIEQFGSLLDASQPSISINRRQTREAAHNAQQGPQKQSFAEAIARSTMPKEDKEFWLN